MDRENKICAVCGIEKDVTAFYFRKDTNKYKNTCLECENLRKKNYYIDNKKYLLNKQQEYKLNHQTEIKEYQDNYNIVNSNKKKQYKIDNMEEILASNRKYFNNKYKYDPIFRMRATVSKTVYNALKMQAASKNGSILSCLTYTMQELKEHIEKQFEPWMNWDNHGIYNKNSWDDNNSTTWTWQIDHIIPQSDLPYTSMEDDNFKKCWSLDNLRPLSAKQNLLDGVGRTRHGITRKKTSKKD